MLGIVCDSDSQIIFISKLYRLVNACWELDAQVDGDSLHLPPGQQRPSLAEFKEALWEVSPYFGIDVRQLVQSRVERTHLMAHRSAGARVAWDTSATAS